MGRKRAGHRRGLRLVLAGLLWFTVLLAMANLTRPGLAPAVRLPSATQSLQVERGRLPDDMGASVRSRADARLGRVVAELSARRPAVHCWSRAHWKRRTADSSWRVLNDLGPWRAYTSVDRRAIHLSPEVCAQLAKLAGGGVIRSGADADASAWSVAALAHEAQHAAGFSNEVQADCFGMQFIETAARLLGRTADEGRFLATVYAKHWYPWHDERYRSDECRNGGALDLRPGVDVWP